MSDYDVNRGRWAGFPAAVAGCRSRVEKKPPRRGRTLACPKRPLVLGGSRHTSATFHYFGRLHRGDEHGPDGVWGGRGAC